MSSKKDKIGGLLGQRSRTESTGSEGKRQLIEGMQESAVTIQPTTPREKFEDRFTRATVFIENELLDMLNTASQGGKGEKTRIVNDALKKYFDSM